MIIYADVLVVVNYIVNFLLLLCLEKLSAMAQKRKNTVLGAVFGGAFSLIIFLPPLHFVLQASLRLLGAVAMVWVAYYGTPWRIMVKLSLIFFAISFVFAGGVLAINLTVQNDLLNYYNGIVYLHLSPLLLLLGVTAAYLFLNVFNRLFGHGQGDTAFYLIEITNHGKTVQLKALQDSGNALQEPFSGLGVLVCDYSCIASILPPQARQWYNTPTAVDNTMPLGARLIPYTTVHGQGSLGAFRPQHLRVKAAGGNWIDCAAYVAVTPKIEAAGYQAIANPDIIRLKI